MSAEAKDLDSYCESRFSTIRRKTREVMIGSVGVGGDHPIRVQSMTTTDTKDIDATVKQSIALAEVGCEIIRITAPNLKAAKALDSIRKKFSAAGFSNPLVADIHFLPRAAMEAIEHVEKVRVNPGNYADSKKFNIREYTDQQYNEELDRIYDGFSPLVKRAKELGRCLRIGTNHGSLSDRIMNRYGDSPMGMVESALEFIRIAESHSFHSILLSMKSSNPKVMIEAYRLVVAKMNEEGMNYPLHLGVTEAGEGEDARVKSAIGIGSLLYDGLGDTIRVSLTEDPVYEVPVARDLASKAMALWHEKVYDLPIEETTNPYVYNKRKSLVLKSSQETICPLGKDSAPRVILPVSLHSLQKKEALQNWKLFQDSQKEAVLEGALISLKSNDWSILQSLDFDWQSVFKFRLIEWEGGLPKMGNHDVNCNIPTVLVPKLENSAHLEDFLTYLEANIGIDLGLDGEVFAWDLSVDLLEKLRTLQDRLLFYSNSKEGSMHSLGTHRWFIQRLEDEKIESPIWIRNTEKSQVNGADYFSDRLLESSMLSGALLCDGFGDAISIESESLIQKGTQLAYAILQGSRTRITKTEFVACPSCGRTLFDLQSTTQKIKSRTGHLKGVTIAVMGCIVNGPGEMADADFGYVGGAPSKVNLYVGKECVQYHIPEKEALDRLIDLIKEHKKWMDAE